MDNVLECGDGTECNIEKSELTWGCCMKKRRAKCPANFPVMCASKSCGYQNKQHCCDVTEDKCKEVYGGGSRKCDAKRRCHLNTEYYIFFFNYRWLSHNAIFNTSWCRYFFLECMECYGAQWLKNQCCNTCEAVVLLYQIRDWQFDSTKFSQCDPGSLYITFYHFLFMLI